MVTLRALVHLQVGSTTKFSTLSLEASRDKCRFLSDTRKRLERAAKGQVARLAASEGRLALARLENVNLRDRVAAQDREFEVQAGVPRERVKLLAMIDTANKKFESAGTPPLPPPPSAPPSFLFLLDLRGEVRLSGLGCWVCI
jgi:hypothetical protein